MCPRPHAAVLVAVSNPTLINLEFDLVDEISTQAKDFSSIAAIFSFRGL